MQQISESTGVNQTGYIAIFECQVGAEIGGLRIEFRYTNYLT